MLVRTARRAALALAMAGVVAGAVRLRGSGEVPAQRGGWRELSSTDLK
jgi:alpha-beta hydrolase superfamily lysophospholipase